MRYRLLAFLLLVTACFSAVRAQVALKRQDAGSGSEETLSNGTIRNGTYEDEEGRTVWGRDSTSGKKDKKIPMGQFQWTIDPRLGTVIDAENNDTVVHNFQNYNNTEGYTGEYNILGNLGSPRLSRVFLNRRQTDDFLFLRPLSYFRGGLQDFRFTNTLSPITNLAYHKAGSNQKGEDHLRAYFASNINKLAGIGFKLDYLYGRGYYNSQANSMFGGTVYGYYRGERYNVHAYVNVNHMKMAENGGIENDKYITDPESFQQSYGSTDIPVMLSETWNRNHEQNFYLTHRYNLGFYRDIVVPDSLKPKPPSSSEMLLDLPDSIQTVLRSDSVARQHAVDSLMAVWKSKQVQPREFIPVSSIIHTMDIRRLTHSYAAHETPDDYYTNHYYGEWDDVMDKTKAMSVRNTFGLAMREGFNKWAQMGITLFATHKLRTYQLMDIKPDTIGTKKYTENDISVGGEIARTQGKFIHYNVNAEFWLIGPNVGDFDVDGKTCMEFRFSKRDSLSLDLHAYVKHQKPDFYYRHYHSQMTWWDNDDLDREIRTRVEGTLRLKKFGTWLNVGFENVGNYTYFGMVNTLKDGATEGSTVSGDYTHAVAVKQQSSSIQVLSATLGQDLKFGPFHWDSQVTWQKSSNDKCLPLPTVSLYTNAYLLFRIAKVLRVQIGGDMRYFTSYYAPDYAPSIQQFAVQDDNGGRIKIGNYPIINAYANLHLKHCRLYVTYNNALGGSKNCFWAPHYAINPANIHFGVSWNFFN